jgi:hypothetical protein
MDSPFFFVLFFLLILLLAEFFVHEYTKLSTAQSLQNVHNRNRRTKSTSCFYTLWAFSLIAGFWRLNNLVCSFYPTFHRCSLSECQTFFLLFGTQSETLDLRRNRKVKNWLHNLLATWVNYRTQKFMLVRPYVVFDALYTWTAIWRRIPPYGT